MTAAVIWMMKGCQELSFLLHAAVAQWQRSLLQWLMWPCAAKQQQRQRLQPGV